MNSESVPNTLLETNSLQQVRKRTFSHWSHRIIQSSTQMIEAGFFYCNLGDRVICIYCNLICQQWTPDTDDPCEVHQTLSPNCAYVKAKLIRPAASLEMPKHFASFATWPNEDLPSVDDLVRAGFFYTGTKTIVTCFYCNGSLQSWRPNDNPLIEHARQCPNCTYARQLCGDDLYRKIQESKQTQQEGVRNNEIREKAGSSGILNTNRTINSRLLLIPDDRTFSRLVTARLDLPMSQRLLDQNFKLSIIKRCWEDQLQIKGDDFVSECDLQVACLILQKQIEHIDGKKENIVIPSYTLDSTEEIEKTTEREKSFSHWFLSSPSRLGMITAGWFLDTTKETDSAICLYCGAEHNHWKYDDNPWSIHQKLSPDCPFLLSSHPMHSSSVPTKDLREIFIQEKIDSDVTQPNSTLIFPSKSYYRLPTRRYASFSTFPGGLPTNIEALVRSGFYYCGNGTRLQCYHCEIGITNFHHYSSNEINVQHLRQFPTCRYAQLSLEENAARSTSWFVDKKTSNDVDINTFSEALSAAINLTDTFSWPINQFSFQSVHKNVSDSNIYSSVHQICNRLEFGAVGSISSIDNPKTHLFELFMTRLHISMISLNYLNYNKQDLTLLNKPYHLTMKIDLLPALVAFIKRYKITKLFYIMEGDEAFDRFQTLIVAQAREKSYDILDIQGRQLNDITNSNNTKNLLQSIEIKDRGSKEELYIVLDLNNINSYIKLLMQIRHHAMTTPHYHYILMSLEADRIDMRTFRYGGVNVTYFVPRSPYTMNPSLDGSIIDRLSLPSFEKKALADALSIYMRAIMLLDDRIRSKIVYSDSNDNNFDHLKIQCRTKTNQQQHELFSEELFNIMKSLSFDGYSGHIAFNEYGERINYTLNMYQVTMNRLPKNIGNFTRDEFSLHNLSIVEGRQVHDFDKGKERIISTILDEPFTMLNESVVGNLTVSDALGQYFTFDELYGYCVDLARVICEKKLEIPCKFRIAKDNSFGNKPADDQPWTGMIGELVRHEVDLAIAPLTITSQRENAVDFSKPWMNLGISILMSKPERTKPDVFSFMAPLSKDIWMCVTFAYIGVSVILFLVSRFSPYEWSMKNEETLQLSNKFSILNTLFFALAAFMQQGVDFIPRSISGRLVASVWWYFSMILVSSYTANWAAFLTVGRMVTSIESVEDLARQREIKYGVVRGGATQAFFEKSDVKIFHRMWTYMQQSDDVLVASNEEGISKVRKSNGKYAFLLESTRIEYTNERSPCDTMRIGSNLDSKGYGIATPVGSELREAINIAILDMSEDGILNSLKKKWWYDRSECHSTTTKESKQNIALNLVNVAGIFYILIGGLALAILIAVLEFFVKANNEAKQTKNNFVDVMRRNMRLSIAGIQLNEAAAMKMSLRYSRRDNYQSSDRLFEENGHVYDNNQSQV
ncbi:unnamed protein product [Rotaria sordida]|uniref:Uncharacterized protein n=1 Tax=Rotaria sordida TaxID=392033 RepID=A0A819C7P9_9BILA|nr:unnamed protein product [Rotaria sordida]